MKLDEAKQILKRAGYLVRSLNEDTETDDDAYADAVANNDYDKQFEIEDRNDNLLRKAWNAKFYNDIFKHRREITKKLNDLGVPTWFFEEYAFDPSNYQGQTTDGWINMFYKLWQKEQRIGKEKEYDSFIDQAYDKFLDDAGLDEDDDSLIISKTKDSFNFAYKKSVWEDLGEWAIVKVNVTSNSIKWKQIDEDGKLISNEMKLSGSNEDKIEQLENWIAREWWGEN